MNKQQKMLMSAERAIKRLAKLAWKLDKSDLAAWMIQGVLAEIGHSQIRSRPLGFEFRDEFFERPIQYAR
jgi:hypothetical protein